ncbi:MAG: Ig-like domain-containing protein, partial [Nitrososphaeraceae archaeon]|nr:Ig-like domain-containing protein [Nitrososphaeraceae archaeon]
DQADALSKILEAQDEEEVEAQDQADALSKILEAQDETEVEAQDETEVEEEESPNVPPTAQDVSVTTTQNQQVDIKLNANDANGDKLEFTIVDDPSDGKLGNIDSSTNTVTYTPDDDYSGGDSFEFIANDGDNDSNEATVSITVEEAQDEEEDQD